jgi:hypothetical protein
MSGFPSELEKNHSQIDDAEKEEVNVEGENNEKE